MKVEVLKKNGGKICTEGKMISESEKRLIVRLNKDEAEMYFKEEIESVHIKMGSIETEKGQQAEQETMKQPELPKLKNNDQRKEWLRNYKTWGLWYKDENTECEYYKYDFENGARLVAEVYKSHSEYIGDYESCYLHLIGGPVVKNAKWERHEKYLKHPDNETALVEFLKYIQK